MATCLGHRARTREFPNGTGCYHRSRSTQKRENWENWQLCHECARKLHANHYKDKKNHGVRKVKETQYFETPFTIEKMPTSTL